MAKASKNEGSEPNAKSDNVAKLKPAPPSKAETPEIDADGAARTPGEISRVHFDGTMPLDEAVSYFEAIAAGMKKGLIRVREGDATLTLVPPPHVTVEMKAKRKGSKEKISFELSWRVAEKPDFDIGSD